MKKNSAYSKLDEKPIDKIEDINLSFTYSYAHYLTWLFEDRVELIKGKLFPMSAPSRVHQKILIKILLPIANFLNQHPCEVYVAPFDVRFPKGSIADKDVFTVLQPDICIVCDSHKLDDKGCIGAPDLVVEILSPGNTKMELFYKFKVYEEFGVKEYWVVNFKEGTVLVYRSSNNKFNLDKLYTIEEEIASVVLPGFRLKLAEVFNVV